MKFALMLLLIFAYACSNAVTDEISAPAQLPPQNPDAAMPAVQPSEPAAVSESAESEAQEILGLLDDGLDEAISDLDALQ